MNTVLTLIIFITSLPPTWYPPGKAPETAQERKARLTMVSEVIWEAASEHPGKIEPKDAAALVATIWYHEAAYDYHVHAGLKSPIGHQDHGLAKCLGQIQTWEGNTLLTKAEHKALPGLSREATKRCAKATLDYLWEHAQRCHRPKMASMQTNKEARWKSMRYWEASKLFAAYGRGRCGLQTKKSRNRGQTWKRLRESMNKRHLHNVKELASKKSHRDVATASTDKKE